MTKQNKAFKFRLLPNKKQEVLLAKTLVVFVLSTIKCWQNARKLMKSSKMTKRS